MSLLGKADVPLRLGQPQQRQAERRLARAALADDAERGAGAHRERDAVDRLDVAVDPAQHAAADRKPHLDVLALDQLRRRGIGRRRPALRLGGEQAARVGVVRAGEDLGGRAGLDDLARCHDADLVGHLADDRQIVGDQQQRHAEAVAQILQELQDVRLDRHVERRRRLVGDQHVGLVGDRHRDHDPLALAARELVRIGAEPALGIGQADQPQQFEGALARRRRRTCACGSARSRRSAARACAAG